MLYVILAVVVIVVVLAAAGVCLFAFPSHGAAEGTGAQPRGEA